MKTGTLLFLLSIFVNYSIQASSEGFKLRKTLSNFVHPESTLITNSYIYVSDMGKDTKGIKSGDGSIYRYFLDGKRDTSFELKEALHSPMGMAQVGELLFTVDIDAVIGISVVDGTIRYRLSLEHLGANFLNDIVSVNNRYLLLTATNLKKVFALDYRKNLLRELDIDLEGSAPNGIAYDHEKKLLAIASNKRHALGEYGNGKILTYKLNIKAVAAKKITQTSIGRFLDGISLVRGRIYASDWMDSGDKGVIYGLSVRDLKLVTTYQMKTSGLADFDMNDSYRLLVTPDLIAGKVRIYSY